MLLLVFSIWLSLPIGRTMRLGGNKTTVARAILGFTSTDLYDHTLQRILSYVMWHRVDCVWNVMAHAQKPYFVLRRNGRVHLNRRGRQFSRLLAGELRTSACRVCAVRASLCSAVMWRLLVTHSILLFPLHFSSRVSPCAITFQQDSTTDQTCTLWNYRESYSGHCENPRTHITTKFMMTMMVMLMINAFKLCKCF